MAARLLLILPSWIGLADDFTHQYCLSELRRGVGSSNMRSGTKFPQLNWSARAAHSRRIAARCRALHLRPVQKAQTEGYYYILYIVCNIHKNPSGILLVLAALHC
jgi:hypothetical protein